eukprot:1523072-Pleurochrysis_carterae.AAC.1
MPRFSEERERLADLHGATAAVEGTPPKLLLLTCRDARCGASAGASEAAARELVPMARSSVACRLRLFSALSVRSNSVSAPSATSSTHAAKSSVCSSLASTPCAVTACKAATDTHKRLATSLRTPARARVRARLGICVWRGVRENICASARVCVRVRVWI